MSFTIICTPPGSSGYIIDDFTCILGSPVLVDCDNGIPAPVMKVKTPPKLLSYGILKDTPGQFKQYSEEASRLMNITCQSRIHLATRYVPYNPLKPSYPYNLATNDAGITEVCDTMTGEACSDAMTGEACSDVSELSLSSSTTEPSEIYTPQSFETLPKPPNCRYEEDSAAYCEPSCYGTIDPETNFTLESGAALRGSICVASARAELTDRNHEVSESEPTNNGPGTKLERSEKSKSRSAAVHSMRASHKKARVRSCWTCRLAHTRCGSQKPHCRSCRLLGIACGGYTVESPYDMADSRTAQGVRHLLKVMEYTNEVMK